MSKITILDGGMGQELLKRSGDRPTPLWATQVMADHPGLVETIHRDYFDAGAEIATANTYAIHRDRLEGTPLESRFFDLLDLALSEAEAARAAAGRGRIAGSIGPLVASYRPDIHPAHDEAVTKYAEIARHIGPRVDLILCESVASLAHARAVLEGAGTAGRPVWLSVTVDDEDGRLLRSGERVSDVAGVAAGAEALLANCSAPEAMAAALRELGESGKRFGAYANGFRQITKAFLQGRPTVDALESRDISASAYADFAADWVALGATILGGCCEIGPDHIRELSRRFGDTTHG